MLTLRLWWMNYIAKKRRTRQTLRGGFIGCVRFSLESFFNMPLLLGLIRSSSPFSEHLRPFWD